MPAPQLLIGPRMEIDAREWLDDLDRRVDDTSTSVALLSQKQDHHYDTVNRQSDERLAFIKERFDRLEAVLMEKQKQDENYTSRLMGLLGTLLVTLSTAVWFTVLEPMQEDLALLERRLHESERYRATISTHVESR